MPAAFGAARVGDNYYADHDGNVYKDTGSGWDKYENGSWNSVQDDRQTQTLNTQQQARQWGDQRSASASWGSRSWGGGFSGFDRGGSGGGFSGFDRGGSGGGFSGFDRGGGGLFGGGGFDRGGGGGLFGGGGWHRGGGFGGGGRSWGGGSFGGFGGFRGRR
jgi:hypothetical protein